MHVQVDQREVGAQPVVVLGQALYLTLSETEDPFQDAERMFHLGPHAGLTPVLFLL
jgi:hypothetical protein